MHPKKGLKSFQVSAACYCIATCWIWEDVLKGLMFPGVSETAGATGVCTGEIDGGQEVGCHPVGVFQWFDWKVALVFLMTLIGSRKARCPRTVWQTLVGPHPSLIVRPQESFSALCLMPSPALAFMWTSGDPMPFPLLNGRRRTVRLRAECHRSLVSLLL